MTTDGAFSEHLVSARWQSLQSSLAPLTGPMAAYVAKVLKVDYKPKTSGGDIIKLLAGDGSACYLDIQPYLVEGADLEVTTCGDDPELKATMVGGTMLTAAPAAGATRSFSDAGFTAGSPNITSAANGNFVAGDVGKQVTSSSGNGQVLPALTFIKSVTSATQVVMTQPANQTVAAGSGQATVFTRGSTVGYLEPGIGLIGNPLGTSFECWTDAGVGGVVASDVAPALGSKNHHVFPRVLWLPPDRTFDYGAPALVWKGVCLANPAWSNTSFMAGLTAAGLQPTLGTSIHGELRETTAQLPAIAIGLQTV